MTIVYQTGGVPSSALVRQRCKSSQALDASKLFWPFSSPFSSLFHSLHCVLLDADTSLIALSQVAFRIGMPLLGSHAIPLHRFSRVPFDSGAVLITFTQCVLRLGITSTEACTFVFNKATGGHASAENQSTTPVPMNKASSPAIHGKKRRLRFTGGHGGLLVFISRFFIWGRMLHLKELSHPPFAVSVTQ